jgi:hypothetical protein
MRKRLAGLGFLVTCALPFAATGQTMPEGTIIAWRPSLDAIDTAKKTVDLPKGWKVCEFSGSRSTSVYLKGFQAEDYAKAFDPADLALKGLYGGLAEHGHAASAGPATAIKNNLGEKNETHAADSLHSHAITVNPAPNDPPYAAVIWLCSKGDQAIANFTSYGYGGDKITLARAGKGYAAAMPRSYAVCNSGSAGIAIEFRSLSSRTSAKDSVNDGDTIAQGECVGMDSPAWLRVSITKGGEVISGQFYALRAGTFPKDGRRFKLNALDSVLRQSIGSGRVPTFDFDEAAAFCKELPKKSPLRKTFYSSCSIALPRKGNYRLCFPKGFAVGAPDNYAFGSIRLIVDPKLINSGFTGNLADPSSAAPMGSCMDLWDADAAIVLIAPANKSPDSPHDPTKISEIRASVRTLGYEVRMK